MSNRMLQEPFNLAGMKLRNRLVRSGTYEKLASEDGFVTDPFIKLYEMLAMGGSGLIITGGALVHPSGRALRKMLCVHNNSYIDGLAELTGAVHVAGGIIALQLNHGGRQCPPLMLGGEQALAPSAVPDPATGSLPRAMSQDEIWMIVEAFADAAWRARAAGFDAVQIQAAHGYLISAFLSPHTNRRDDYWGGDVQRRLHFSEEVLKAVRSSVGGDYPVLVKMNCDDLLPGGLKPGESLQAASAFQSFGADAVEISGGMLESEPPTVRGCIEGLQEEAYFRREGRLFKGSLSVPVILTGGIRSRQVMEKVIENGEADLVGLSRPLIMEPDLPERLMEGREKAHCSSCNHCTRFGRLSQVKCTETARLNTG